MLWYVLVIGLGVLLWGAFPRAVRDDAGFGPDYASVDPPASPPRALRVATFNIHGCRGGDGRRDPARIAADLDGVDVAALQEVHNSWRAPRQLPFLSARLKMSALDAPTRRRWFRRHRSNALLSRLPVGAWTRTALPGDPGGRFHFRSLTTADLGTEPPIHVLFTHLNRKGGREAQLSRVMEEFLARSPAILMGDLNMTREHPALQAYLARDDVIDALAVVLPDDSPLRIDWILCRGLAVQRGGVIDSGASDHPLYWVEIEL